MKKVLAVLFLGSLALNSTVVSMEKPSTTLRSKLSNMDRVKVIAASAGCAFLGAVALTTLPQGGHESSWSDVFKFPLLALMKPYGSWLKSSPTYVNASPLKQISQELVFQSKINRVAGLVRIISGLGACGLGAYVYKKLSVLRYNKPS